MSPSARPLPLTLGSPSGGAGARRATERAKRRDFRERPGPLWGGAPSPRLGGQFYPGAGADEDIGPYDKAGSQWPFSGVATTLEVYNPPESPAATHPPLHKGG